MVKRFLIETTTTSTRFKFITDHKDSKLLYAHCGIDPVVEYSWKSKNQKFTKYFTISQYIAVKGWKALGNRLSDFKVLSVKVKEDSTSKAVDKNDIEFEIISQVQKKLF